MLPGTEGPSETSIKGAVFFSSSRFINDQGKPRGPRGATPTAGPRWNAASPQSAYMTFICHSNFNCHSNMYMYMYMYMFSVYSTELELASV